MSHEVSVTVVYAQSDSVAEVELRLAAGATVAQALETAAKAGLDMPDLAHAPVGIFGKRCPRDAVVKHGDRIEVYRPLIADPKDSRRRRARVK
ncbi:MAG: RnfH family protein [Betaproteobacteria bacterium]|nr:MAG: RnfH family protein [Betaproteobacteria bacterium]